jgi:hypothetical protein
VEVSRPVADLYADALASLVATGALVPMDLPAPRAPEKTKTGEENAKK